MWHLNFAGNYTQNPTNGPAFAVLAPTGINYPVFAQLEPPIGPRLGITETHPAQNINAALVNTGPNAWQVTAPPGATSIAAASQAGKSLEIIGFDPTTAIVTLGGNADPQIPVTIAARQPGNATNAINPSLFQFFWNQPIKAELSWSIGFESHPSGSIAIAVAAPFDEAVHQRFRVGTEFEFAGIGWVVSNYAAKAAAGTPTDRGGIYEITVSIEGRWAKRQYNRPIPFIPPRPLGSTAPYTDPECLVGANITDTSRPIPRTLSVADLGLRNGVPIALETPSIALDNAAINATTLPFSLRGGSRNAKPASLNPWTVIVPKDVSATTTTEWESELRSRLRMNNCYLDLSDAAAVQVRDLESTPSWQYAVRELSWTAKGDTAAIPGYWGYGYEYAAAKLTGAFSQPQDSSPTAPARWKRKRPVRLLLPSGDQNPSIPPNNLNVAGTLSLNWDASGPTKEQLLVETEDGMEIRRQRWVWGIAVTSNQALQPNGEIRYFASAYWQVVQYEDTQSLIDNRTGYILGSRTTGWALRRFKQETDEGLEIARKFAAPEDSADRALYQFRRSPIYAGEKRVLSQFAEFYKDAAREVPPIETRKICLPNGQAAFVGEVDPNYIRPMFAIAERTYRTTFDSTPNPDSTQDEPLPPLMMGEELDTIKSIKILPSNQTTGAVGFEGRTEVDLYQQFTSNFSAQGSNFNEVATQKTFETSQGRPGAAQRRPDQYERDEPDSQSGDNAAAQQAANNRPQPEYILCTPGYQPNQITGQTIDAPHARTLAQALQHAKAELKVQDAQSSVNFNTAIPFNALIRPMHRIKAMAYGKQYDLRVLSVSQSVQIQGTIDGVPLFTANQTQVTAGLDRTIPFTTTSRPAPGTTPPGEGPNTVIVISNSNIDIGDLSVPIGRGRGKYYG
jgi:hypothetical protein